MNCPFTLEGKTILVTGASSGIGRATAIECSKLGATLVLTGRNRSALQETMSLMDGNRHAIITADLSNYDSVVSLVKLLPDLDGAVLNAGISKMAPILFIKEGDLENVFKMNTFSPIILLKNLIKHKKLKKPSSVVFTSSIAGYSNIIPTNSMYGAAKSALTAYMKYAALELAGKGIRCNAVHPGMVNTPLIQSRSISEEDLKIDLKKYPLGRYGMPEEIAWSIIYLLSDASAWMTGSDLIIDGGRSLI